MNDNGSLHQTAVRGVNVPESFFDFKCFTTIQKNQITVKRDVLTVVAKGLLLPNEFKIRGDTI